MSDSEYHITIIGWEKHNPAKKKGYTHFMVSKGIFNDIKIANLSASEFRFYVFLLTVAADLRQSSYTLSAQLVPRYFTGRAKLIHSWITALEQNQLLTAEKIQKNGSNRIEKNRIEENRKEEKRIEKNILSGEVENEENPSNFFTKIGPPKKPKNSLSETEKSENQKIKAAFIDAYRQRYKVEPLTKNAMFNSQVSALRKKLGVEDSIRLIEFYLQHNDGFYLKKTHSFGLCLSDADTLFTQMQKGKALTSNMVRDFERKNKFTEMIDQIEKGEI